ncbi:hypothetical protein GS399_09255 [Pedobacter sp. HMF7647]|uniref:Outer membrane beta-barrel protein n=1 Tax=Hufsiella arboris TaxID=2695275 RepID=A0A7K1Y9A0_9SPHI|nr:hypothetical protein [Hufsiella arboris]MXV51155.1 hypothetical protein [Hufsiella arboris]
MPIRKTWFLILVVLGCGNQLFAQQQLRVGLDVMGGYTFADKFNLYNAYGRIDDAGTYGADFSVYLRPTKAIELSYLGMTTHAPLYDYATGFKVNRDNDKVSVNYLLINGVAYLPTGGPLMPYGGAGIGLGIVSADGGDTYTKFAWDLKAGVKIKAGGAVGIKLQAQLNSISQGISGGIYAGTGGAGVGVGSYSSIYQFGFSGGLSFNFQ